MICCGTVALAASLTLAVGRRVAMVLLAAAGVLFDPAGFAAALHAQALPAALCLG